MAINDKTTGIAVVNRVVFRHTNKLPDSRDVIGVVVRRILGITSNNNVGKTVFLGSGKGIELGLAVKAIGLRREEVFVTTKLWGGHSRRRQVPR